MNHEAEITAYLRSHKEAMAAGLPAPDISVLPASVAAGVTRFLIESGSFKAERTRPAIIRESVVQSELTGSIGDENTTRLQDLAVRLQAGIQGEQ